MKLIHDIINAKILNLEKIHDYLQLGTDKGTINIYNHSFYYENECMYDISSLSEEKIKYHIIINAFYEELKHIKLELDNGIVMVVSIAEEDYLSPEAMNIHSCSGEIIVL